LCATVLSTSIGMKPLAVSNQMQRLADLGIVASRREGNTIRYCLIPLPWRFYATSQDPTPDFYPALSACLNQRAQKLEQIPSERKAELAGVSG
jgi:DNA-binding transcriptional ArsR family regulator